MEIPSFKMAVLAEPAAIKLNKRKTSQQFD
jgi:hypothetical protein